MSSATWSSLHVATKACRAMPCSLHVSGFPLRSERLRDVTRPRGARACPSAVPGGTSRQGRGTQGQVRFLASAFTFFGTCHRLPSTTASRDLRIELHGGPGHALFLGRLAAFGAPAKYAVDVLRPR
jgi:hypothetical protein